MKYKLVPSLMIVIVLTVGAYAQTTAFTYQGSLKDGVAVANGNYDFQFALFDAVSGGSQLGSTLTRTQVAVANGIFSVSLDFGSQFQGANRFLEIRVRLSGQPSLTTLTPRQSVNSAPYSIKSLFSETLVGTGRADFIQNGLTLQTANQNISGNAYFGGSVGIGTTSPLHRLEVTDAFVDAVLGNSGAGYGVTGTSNTSNGVYGSSNSGTGVYGSGTNGDGVHGTSSSAIGVSGTSTSSVGVKGVSTNDTGVYGVALGNTGAGVSGVGNSGTGVYGESSTGTGVFGQSTSASGLAGKFIGPVNINGAVAIGTTVQGPNMLNVQGTSGTGIYGTSNAVGATVAAIRGVNTASGGNGIIGEAGSGNGTGVYGVSTSATGYGVIGRNLSGGYAGYFDGNAVVLGFLDLTQLAAGGVNHICYNGASRLSTCSSSLRYKTNIGRFDRGLSLLDRLQPITFDWKSNGMHDVGFGAEDVEKAEPLLVTYNDKGQVEGVKYDRISVVLVNAVKEQQAQIETLRTENVGQQKQNDELRKQVEALRTLVCSIKADAEICKGTEK